MGIISHDQTPQSEPKKANNGSAVVGAMAPPPTRHVGANAPTNIDRHLDFNTARFHVRLDNDLTKQIKIFCITNDLTLTQFVTMASRQLLQDGPPLYLHVGANAPLIDRIDDIGFKTEKAIISLHTHWTNAFNKRSNVQPPPKPLKWTRNDDKAGEVFNEIPIAFVELSMLHVIANKRPGSSPIKSFGYYAEEIRRQVPNLAKLSHVALHAMLTSHTARVCRMLGCSMPPT